VVTRDEVVDCYRHILGREPENEEVVQDYMIRVKNANELREIFLNSAEFRTLAQERTSDELPPIVEPEAIKVQVQCTPKEFDDLLARLRRSWTSLGETEPMWSVLTEERFKKKELGSSLAGFYESGERDVCRYIAWIARNGGSYRNLTTCLEFGCGVGRMTRWIAGLVPRVIACDVSAAHLEVAEDYLRAEGIKNVELIHLWPLSQLENLPPIDSFLSIAVLQHNPPPLIAKFLDNLLHLLKPGGFGYFQVPTFQAGYSFDLKEYFNRPPSGCEIEMHILPQKHIFELAAANGCAVLEVYPDNYNMMKGGISDTFLVRKI
jgi:SAM-dependent methyltransferase